MPKCLTRSILYFFSRKFHSKIQFLIETAITCKMAANSGAGKASETGPTKPAHALFNAVSSSKLRLVRLLIDGGLHVDTRNAQQQTPLLAACSSLETRHLRGETREKVVKYLIEAGANVNVRDKVGRTPLIYAVITRAHSSVVFDLVVAGADLWFEDDSRNCAFDYAVQREEVSQIGVMVEAHKRWKSSSREEESRKSCEKLTRTQSATKHNKKVEGTTDQGTGKQKHIAKALQLSNIYISPEAIGTSSKKTPDDPLRPATSPRVSEENEMHSPSRPISVTPCEGAAGNRFEMFPVVPKDTATSPESLIEEKRLCSLCKNIILEDSDSQAAKDSDGSNYSDLNLGDYDLSGWLYRRRSTGSLFGRTQQRIQWKKSLGITLEDLFSSTEINRPNFGSQSLFVKSRRTNTMVDISTTGLTVPALNRARSASVSLPPTSILGEGFRFLGDQVFAASASEERFLVENKLLPKPSEVPIRRASSSSAIGFKQKGDLVYTSDSRIFLADDGGDDDWDEILVVPPEVMQHRAKSPVHSSSPSPTCGGGSESGARSSGSPPIPRIVFTDVVKTSSKGSEKK